MVGRSVPERRCVDPRLAPVFYRPSGVGGQRSSTSSSVRSQTRLSGLIEEFTLAAGSHLALQGRLSVFLEASGV